MDYEMLKIADGDHWHVQLHENQYYLGRLIIAARRDDDVDLFDMTSEEKEEFFELGKKVKIALTDLFQPDRFNYDNMQNIWHHLHVHVVPRYATPREFDGITFRDERWGKNWSPYPKDFVVPETTLLNIRDAIKGRL